MNYMPQAPWFPQMQMGTPMGRQPMNPMQMMQQIQNHPLYARAKEMANGKTNDQIRQTAMNLCKQRGIDFETAMQQFSEFRKMFGM